MTLKAVRLLIKGGQKLRLNVFMWDDHSGQVGITKCPLLPGSSSPSLNSICMDSLCLLEVYRLMTLAGDPSERFPNYMKLVLQWSTRFFAMIPQIDSLFYGKNKATFVDQVFELDKRFGG